MDQRPHVRRWCRSRTGTCRSFSSSKRCSRSDPSEFEAPTTRCVTFGAGRRAARGVWTVSAGNERRGSARRCTDDRRRSTCWWCDTAPETKLRAIERFRPAIVQAPFDELLAHAGSFDRMHGHFVHPFDDDHFISGNGTIGLDPRRLADVDAVVAPLGGGGSSTGIACVLRNETGPAPGSMRRKPPRRSRLSPPGRQVDARGVVVDGAGGPAGLDVAAGCRSRSSSRRRCEAGAAVADRIHVIAEGRSARRGRDGRDGRARHKRVGRGLAAIST